MAVEGRGRGERGASLVQYALVVALIAAVSIGALRFVGRSSSDKLLEAGGKVSANAGPNSAAWNNLIAYMYGQTPTLTPEAQELASKLSVQPACYSQSGITSCPIKPAGGGTFSYSTTSGQRVNAEEVYVNLYTAKFTTGPNGTGQVVDPSSVVIYN